MKLISVCTALLFGGIHIPGAGLDQTGQKDRINNLQHRLSNMKIENGAIELLKHETSPEYTDFAGYLHQGLPPRTVVRLLLTPESGSRINVELWLPEKENWNLRFLGIGNGGAAGGINPGVLATPLSEGYAVATTDMGTAPNADSGIANQAIWKDFGYRATHLMTVAAKQIVQAFYGREPEFSYFNGRSTGGQQGLQEAQMYPDDYDGIIAGVPAHCRTHLHAYFLWNYQILKKCPFTKSQEANVIAAANEYKAPLEIPSIAGKFISDARCDERDIEAIINLARRRDHTLTDEQAIALRKLFDGPRHSLTGKRIYNGIPPGSAFDGANGNLYLFRWVFGPDRDPMSIDFGADYDTYSTTLGPVLNAENADLSAFAERGGKLLMTSGTADSIVPYHASILYYERVIDQFNSIEQVQDFFRYFILPGMSHVGGPGINSDPDLLDTLRKWREVGSVPQHITGQRIIDGRPVLEMPVYPYPSQTGWDQASSSFKPVEGPRGGVDPIAIPPSMNQRN